MRLQVVLALVLVAAALCLHPARARAQAAAPLEVASVTLSPTSVTGGNGVKGAVTLNRAPTQTTLVQLSSTSPGVAAVPASVAVPARSTSASFEVTTRPVTVATDVRISARRSGGEVTRTASLRVLPAPNPLTVTALTLNPASVTGGTPSTGTVTLSGPVPSSFEFGADVSLSSSLPNVAAVPNSVNVPVGKNSASFQVATARVTTAQTARISASRGGATRTASLTVQPLQQAVPRVGISPPRLDFGSDPVGTPGGRLRVTISNTGNAALTVNGFAITGAHAADFLLRGFGGTNGPIAPGAAAWVEIEFIPRAPGSRAASLIFSSNAAGSPHIVPLSGIGTASSPAVTISPSSLEFGGQTVGTRGAEQLIIVTNTGTAPLAIQGVGIAGANPGDFVLTSGTGAGTLTERARRTITLLFAPTAAGLRRASLIITSSAAGSPHVVPLSGTGVVSAVPAVTLSPASLAFGEQSVGSSSAPQTVTLLNSGTALLVIGGVSFTGDHAGDFALAAGGGGGTLPPGGRRTISIVFRPTAGGSRIASLTVVTNAPGSPHRVALFGIASVSQVPPGSSRPVLPSGQAVAATGRLGIFSFDPPAADQDVSAIRRIGEDGSLYVLDYAGTALLRFTAAGPQILLDTTRLDADRIGLARLLRVETGRDGTNVVLALRADNTRGIYRLQRDVLTRLALLPEPTGPAELTISDAGQIAYVAPSAAGPLALFQSLGGQTVELLRQGQVLANGAAVVGFSDLTANGAGDLAFLAALRLADGSPGQAVLRRRGALLEVVALTGQTVARDRRGSGIGRLAEMRRPRIGPDGTVVFLGSGDGFVNFYAARLGLPLEALLVGVDWNPDPGASDYESDANGMIALRAAPGNGTDSLLFFAAPGAEASLVVGGRRDTQPLGRPALGPNGLLFFLARNLDLPPDRNDRAPVGLFRYRLGEAGPTAVALPGQAVPGRPGARLLSVTQRPAVSPTAVAFGILFSGPENDPVPTGALFRVPLLGTLAQGSFVAAEGADLPGADRLAMLRDLSYLADGTLVFGGLLPGAGPVVALLQGSGVTSQGTGESRPAAIASASRARIAQAATVGPLMSIGDPMDPASRRLVAVLGRLVALGADRQLLVARFSRPDGLNGEGLFTVDRSRQVDSVAATGEAARDLVILPFAGFADTVTQVLNPPSVAADGTLVFKARLQQGGSSTDGLFQWTGPGAEVTALGLRNPSPDNLRVLPGDLPPYELERWVAGGASSVYFTARPNGGRSRLYRRLAGASPLPLVVPGLTPVAGASAGTLTDLLSFAVTGSGRVFVHGRDAGGLGMFRVDADPSRLTPIIRPNTQIPAPADGTRVQGITFDGSLDLQPDSTRGALVFRAGVTQPGGAKALGLFRLNAQDQVETLMVEGLAVGGARDVTFGTLGTSPARQTLNGTTVWAERDKGRWSIVRWRAGTRTVVAQEGQPLPAAGGARVVSLDPGPVLDLPAGAGPVFTVNEAGHVAFLASDGLRWGIYLFEG